MYVCMYVCMYSPDQAAATAVARRACPEASRNSGVHNSISIYLYTYSMYVHNVCMQTMYSTI